MRLRIAYGRLFYLQIKRSLVEQDAVGAEEAKPVTKIELAPYENVEVPDVFLVVRT